MTTANKHIGRLGQDLPVSALPFPSYTFSFGCATSFCKTSPLYTIRTSTSSHIDFGLSDENRVAKVLAMPFLYTRS